MAATTRTSTGIDPNARYSSNIYDPYNMGTSGYGRGQDPYGPSGSASSLAEDTTRSNLHAAPDIAKLSQLINSLNEASQQQLNASRLGPQGQQIQGTLLENIQAGASGLLDPTTEQMLRQNLASSGAAGGFGVDSANLASAYTRALGLDIADREAQAQKDYLAMLEQNPSAPLYDASKLLVSPETFSQTASQQANRQIEEERLAQQAYEFDEKQRAAKAALSVAKTGQKMGYNTYGEYVPRGQYGFGYFDRVGRFHGGASPSSVGG
jgi:hypothetical protein